MDKGRELHFDWRRAGAAIAGLVATMVLLGMVFLVAISNRQRDAALESERHAYDVNLLTRAVDASLVRAEAALGAFVLDEDERGNGNVYYSQWRLAGEQIRQLDKLVADDPEQSRRVDQLEQLYERRTGEFAGAARAVRAKQGTLAINTYYQASQSHTGPALQAKLSEISRSEREALKSRVAQTEFFSAEADRLTDYLSWLGVLAGIGGIVLGAVAIKAVRQTAASRREAESEYERSQALEAAVADRTQALQLANEALRTEAVERQSAEAQLRQVQKMEAVGQLTGGIAHDFNNMLAVVVGGIDLARRRLNGPRREVMLHLNNAMEGATRAAALTRRLLSFARSEPLLPERVDSSALVSGMSDLLDRTLGERILVETNLDPNAWPTFVDPHQLENAIVNLAVNARDAMEGTGRLVIETANVTMAPNAVGDIRAGDYVRISVTDTGAGMPPEVIERAFEPFFTTKPVGKGTGLGLSQIFGFAHQSGGEVGIESQLGRGTTVSMYLPRTDATATVRLHPTLSKEEVTEQLPSACILLVEDDPRVRAATVGALEDLDYDPVACASGAEAIAMFDSKPFDLVISDVVMPEMTGPELVRILKTKRPDIAILFVTGYVGEGEGHDLVGHELLRKPFTVGALASAIRRALDRGLTELPRSGAAAATG